MSLLKAKEARPLRTPGEAGEGAYSSFSRYLESQYREALVYALASGRCSSAQEARARRFYEEACEALVMPIARGGGIPGAARLLKQVRAELGAPETSLSAVTSRHGWRT